MSDFTEKWTTAAADEIAKIIERAIAGEREACAIPPSRTAMAAPEAFFTRTELSSDVMEEAAFLPPRGAV